MLRLSGENFEEREEMEIQDVLKLMKDEEIAYVDVRFTDPKGKLQHVTIDVDLVDEDFFEEGFMFDGSFDRGLEIH